MGLFRLNLIMKIEICPYSGYKIYPGRGRTLIKQDGKTFKFLDSRSHKAHLLKRNQKPDVRKAQREQAIRAAKEVKKTQKATKKPAAAATKAKTVKPATKSTKNVQKAAPRVGGKR